MSKTYRCPNDCVNQLESGGPGDNPAVGGCAVEGEFDPETSFEPDGKYPMCPGYKTSKTTVVNIRETGYDVYVGRPYMFGNPFEIGKDGTRKEVIEKFRKYFYERLRTDQKFRDAVHDLRGKRLGCFCKPLPCHCDVYAEYLNGQSTV